MILQANGIGTIYAVNVSQEDPTNQRKASSPLKVCFLNYLEDSESPDPIS